MYVCGIYGGYICWLILILLCSLKTYLSFKTWKQLLESRGYLIHIFFSGGHLSTHCFRYLEHLSIFFQYSLFLFMNNFCIDHASFSIIGNFSRETFIRTWSIYPNKLIFVSIPSVGVEDFWVDGKHVLRTASVEQQIYVECR